MADHKDISDKRYIWSLIFILILVAMILGFVTELVG